MKPGWNPIRRNKNIGTSKQGYGKNNWLVIPERWSDDRIFWERLNHPTVVKTEIGDIPTTFLVEPTHPGFTHACTIDDIIRILQKVPQHNLQGIELIILRQPTRKQNLISPCWGRIGYWADIGKYSGTAIYLEAQCISQVWHWSKRLSPDMVKELERLREDGHGIATDKRYYLISSTLDSIRNTQLYRTLPHEIGHYVDYLVNVIEPGQRTDNEQEQEWLSHLYHSKTTDDKEAFANRYADEFRAQLLAEKYIPFPRLVDETKMIAEHLNLEWFQ